MATATGVDSANGLSYIGNDDYRGYLNYLAQSGDANASSLISGNAGKGFVDNTGTIGTGNGFYVMPSASGLASANSNYYNAWNTPVKTNNTGGAGSGTSAQNITDSINALTDANTQNQSQLDSTEASLKNGLAGLADEFNKTTGRANEDQNTALANYDKQRTATTQNKLDSTDKIYQNGNTLAQSVRRILGMASGANSSAYQITAPGAIAKDMTIKTNQNAANFKQNYDNIDTAQNNTTTAFQRYMQDLGDEKSQKESGLRSGILQQEQSIYGDMANNNAKVAQLKGGTYLDGKAAAAGNIAQAQARQAQIDNLFSQYRTPYATPAPVAATATTADFTPTATKVNNGAPVDEGGDSSPYALALKKIFGGQTAPAGAIA